MRGTVDVSSWKRKRVVKLVARSTPAPLLLLPIPSFIPSPFPYPLPPLPSLIPLLLPRPPPSVLPLKPQRLIFRWATSARSRARSSRCRSRRRRRARPRPQALQRARRSRCVNALAFTGRGARRVGGRGRGKRTPSARRARRGPSAPPWSKFDRADRVANSVNSALGPVGASARVRGAVESGARAHHPLRERSSLSPLLPPAAGASPPFARPRTPPSLSPPE